MWDSVQEFSALELNTRFLEKRAHDKTHILDTGYQEKVEMKAQTEQTRRIT